MWTYVINFFPAEPKIMVSRDEEDAVELFSQNGHGCDEILVRLGHIAGDKEHILAVVVAG